VSKERWYVQSCFGFLSGPDPPLIIGGQAVNLWALTFSGSLPQLRELRPFVSRDLDIVGDRELVGKIAAATGFKHTFSGRRSATLVVGYLKGKDPNGDEILIEVLHGVNGLNPSEIQKHRVFLELDGKKYLTLDPPALLKAKIANANELNQASRQDVHHVRILTHCVAGYLHREHEGAAAGSMSQRDLVKLLQFVRSTVTEEAGQRIAKRHGIDFALCFPEAVRDSKLAKVEKFVRHHLAQL
jgi:hypothetical protein